MSQGSASEKAPEGKRRQKKSADAVEPEPKEDTESAEGAKTLHGILRTDYSIYVKLWREPTERKHIKIDKDKKHGQIRRINWDDVARKAIFNQFSQPSGPFLCTLWEDAKGQLWCISGQHTIVAIEQCAQERQKQGLQLEEWHNVVHADILKYDTPLMIRRKIAGHSKESPEAVTPLSLADTADNPLMTNRDEPPIKDIDALDVRILDVLEISAKVSRARFDDDKYKVFSRHAMLSLQFPPSIRLSVASYLCTTHSAPFRLQRPRSGAGSCPSCTGEARKLSLASGCWRPTWWMASPLWHCGPSSASKASGYRSSTGRSPTTCFGRTPP